jgi:PhnB protein
MSIRRLPARPSPERPAWGERPVGWGELSMDINPYLYFDGQCAAAFRFYETCLNGRIVVMQTHGESPLKDQVPADWHDKVIHARLEVRGAVLMGCDTPPQYYGKPRGMDVSITIESPDDAERTFRALSEGGSVRMPFERTFWSAGFGMVVDRFGIPWMINCEQAP